MADIQIVKTDQGAVNARILAKEAKADFRRVEAASLKLRTHFTSAEAKRLFVRMFNTLQLNAHFVSVIARTRIDHQDIEAAEVELRTDIDAVKNKLNQALDGAEALFKSHGISSYATYDTQPLELDVGVLSSSGRRYLEVLNQFDQLMPLLQTLEIHEVITTQALDIERASLKRQIKNIATLARRQATGMRRRMNALGTREDERAADGAAPGRGAKPGRDITSNGAAAPSEQGLPATQGADEAASGAWAGEEGGDEGAGRPLVAEAVPDGKVEGAGRGLDAADALAGGEAHGGESVPVRRVRRRVPAGVTDPETPPPTAPSTDVSSTDMPSDTSNPGGSEPTPDAQPTASDEAPTPAA